MWTTNHSVCAEQDPLEPVPPELWLLLLETAFTQLEYHPFIVVHGTHLAHPLRVLGKRVATTTDFCPPMGPVSGRMELCELCGHVVDREGVRSASADASGLERSL
jgi:hypothetical protein